MISSTASLKKRTLIELSQEHSQIPGYSHTHQVTLPKSGGDTRPTTEYEHCRIYTLQTSNNAHSKTVCIGCGMRWSGGLPWGCVHFASGTNACIIHSKPLSFGIWKMRNARVPGAGRPVAARRKQRASSRKYVFGYTHLFIRRNEKYMLVL